MLGLPAVLQREPYPHPWSTLQQERRSLRSQRDARLVLGRVRSESGRGGGGVGEESLCGGITRAALPENRLSGENAKKSIYVPSPK